MPDGLVDLILSQPEVLLFVKGGVLFILALYIGFSLIVIRQVEIMMKVVIVPISSVFRILIILHAFLSIAVFIFAVIVI